MLSIQAFNQMMNPASRDTERPFKAYPRGPVSLPTSSLYPAYTPQTFPAPSLGLHHSEHPPRRRSDNSSVSSSSSGSATYPFSAMDFRHHSYDSNIMDISNATPGRMPGMGGMDSQVGIKSELDPMTHASSMPQVSQSLSQGAHGYHGNMSLGAGPSGLHMMGHHGTNGADTEPSKGVGGASTDASSATVSAALASGDSPTSMTSDHLAQPSSTTSSKMPPKKRPLAVPEDLKDNSYWEKRKKNNESAKRSREARRMKEEQIAMRVVYLEQENLQLRTEVSLLKSEIEKLRCMLYNS